MRSNSRLSFLLLALAFVFTACAPATAERTAATGDLPPGVSNAFAGMLRLSPAEFRETAEQRGFLTTTQGVVLDVQTQGLQPEHRGAFQRKNLEIRSFRPEYERVSVVARDGVILSYVAQLPYVRQVVPAYGATTGGDAGEY